MPTRTDDYTELSEIETTVQRDDQYREGPVAKKIEQQTAKLPSDLFLWAACGSAFLSLLAQVAPSERAHHRSLFVGQWVPTLLILGVYNKLVKLQGSDRQDARW